MQVRLRSFFLGGDSHCVVLGQLHSGESEPCASPGCPGTRLLLIRAALEISVVLFTRGPDSPLPAWNGWGSCG